MQGVELISHYFPELTVEQRAQFVALGERYAHWNERVNLISRKDIEHLYERHVLHALSTKPTVPIDTLNKTPIATPNRIPAI